MNLLKTEFFQLLAEKGSQRDVPLLAWKKANVHLVNCLPREDLCGMKCGQALIPKNSLQATTSRKTGTSVLELQGSAFCKWSVSLQKDPTSRWEPQPQPTLRFQPVRLWAENQVMPGLLTFRNCGRIHGYCFRPLFVVIYHTAIEN